MSDIKKYYLYAAILCISMFGTDLTEFVLSFWILEQTENMNSYSYFRMFEAIPEVALAPFVGVVIDRFSKKKLLLIGQIVSAIGSLYLALLFWDKDLTPWSVVYVTMIGSIASTVLYGAFFTLTKQMLKPKELIKAMSVVTLLYTSIEFVVPALAPILYKSVKMTNIFMFDVVTFSISICFFSFQKFPKNIRDDEEETISFLEDFKIAWKYLKELKGYRLLVFGGFIMSFLFGVIEFLFVPFIVDVYGEKTLGSLVAIATVGTVIGIAILGGVETVKNPLSKSFLITVIVGIVIVSFSYCVNIYSLAVVLIIIYFLFSLEDIFDDAFELTLIPEKLLGRVAGIEAFFVGLAAPLSYLVAGAAIPYVIKLYDSKNIRGLYETLPSLKGDASKEAQAMLLILFVCGGLLIVTGLLFKSNKALKSLDVDYNKQLELDED